MKDFDPEELIQGKAFVVWTTDDLTEGRTVNYPLAVTKNLFTAERLAKGGYVQGTNCPITDETIFKYNSLNYAPVRLIQPSKMDKEKEDQIITFSNALLKAKNAGLDDHTIEILRAGNPNGL